MDRSNEKADKKAPIDHPDDGAAATSASATRTPNKLHFLRPSTDGSAAQRDPLPAPSSTSARVFGGAHATLPAEDLPAQPFSMEASSTRASTSDLEYDNSGRLNLPKHRPLPPGASPPGAYTGAPGEIYQRLSATNLLNSDVDNDEDNDDLFVESLTPVDPPLQPEAQHGSTLPPALADELPVEATLVAGNGDFSTEDRQLIEQEIRNQILSEEIVVGEPVQHIPAATDEHGAPPPQSSKKRKMICFGMFAFLVCICVAIVLWLVFGKKISSSNTTSSNAIESMTTPSPWMLSPPSPNPTMVPSTRSLSFSPTLSSQPTLYPTISNANRDNTNEAGAKFLELGAPPLEDSLSEFRRLQMRGFGCRRRLAPGLRNFRVGRAWVLPLWYTYTPKTSGPASVIACGPVLNVFVFESDWWCDYDSVRDGVYVENRDVGNCSGASISWEAHEGVTYNMFVNLTDDIYYLPTDDKQMLQLQQNESIVTVQLVDNDLCEHAFGPVPVTSAGKVVSYTTVNATVDYDVVTKTCGGSSAPSAPGVWYKIVGTGQAITAKTCSEQTTFDTQISVFRGDCHTMVCVAGNDDFCGQQSSVTWPSTANETYYLLIHGGSSNSASSIGEFQLTLSTDLDRKSNDFCDSAEEVTEESYVEFVLTGSTVDPDLPPNDGDGLSIPYSDSTPPYGIWFRYLATGDSLFYYFQQYVGESIDVIAFTGACGDLSAVRGEDSYSTPGYYYDIYTGYYYDIYKCIPTISGETYYIFAYTTDLRDIDISHSLEFGKCQIDDENGISIIPIIPTTFIRFNFRFGFTEDKATPSAIPDQNDVEGVVCQIQNFVKEKHLMYSTELSDISWGYYEGQSLPAHINFTVGHFNGDGSPFASGRLDVKLQDYMEAERQNGFQNLITNWIWEAEPKGLNYFSNVNDIEFDSIKGPPVQGDLPRANCTGTANNATIMPTAVRTNSTGAVVGGANGTQVTGGSTGTVFGGSTNSSNTNSGNGTVAPFGGSTVPVHGGSKERRLKWCNGEERKSTQPS